MECISWVEKSRERFGPTLNGSGVSMLGITFPGVITRDLSNPGASLHCVQVSPITVSRIIKLMLSGEASPFPLVKESSEGPL